MQALSQADEALAKGDEAGAIVCEDWLPGNEIGNLVRKRNARIQELLQRQKELAREQQARAEASAELQRINYSMVHDMRAPLRAVTSFGNLLMQEAGLRLGETERSYIDRMPTACERMDRLIYDLLSYTSLLNRDLALAEVSVPDVIRELLSTHPEFCGGGRRIQVQSDMPGVMGDRALLRECFTALLDNAVKYGRPEVPVTVKIAAEATGKDGVRIVVEDNGMGMSELLKSKVFGIFQRGKSAQEGTGIRLAIVRVAVEKMGRAGRR